MFSVKQKFVSHAAYAKSAVAAVLVTAGAAANAALPAGAAEAITAYQTDTVAVFGMLITAGIAIFAVRKLGQKMGWL